MILRIVVMIAVWAAAAPVFASEAYVFHVAGRYNADTSTAEGVWSFDEQGPFEYEVRRAESGKVEAVIDIDQWRTGIAEFSTRLNADISFLENRSGLQAVLTGRYSLLNRKPVDDLRATMRLTAGRLEIERLTLPPFSAQGSIALTRPYSLDLHLRWDDLALIDVADLIEQKRLVMAEGAVSGECRLQGSPDHIQVDGFARSTGGRLGNLEYSFMDIKAVGVWPVLRFAESVIAQSDGFVFRLSGVLDFSEWEKIGSQLAALNKEPLISEDSDSSEWTFKKVRFGERGGTAELKYLRRKNPSGDDTDMIGVERKFEF
ncbi:MAG: hypothetical protein ACLFPX_03315 [Candidatus Omnitrophota bacterium]